MILGIESSREAKEKLAQIRSGLQDNDSFEVNKEFHGFQVECKNPEDRVEEENTLANNIRQDLGKDAKYLTIYDEVGEIQKQEEAKMLREKYSK
ncbi:MAG: hypothetical protein A2Y25_01110 [Candidatus Melainabacteria bacterium GWF2_37_15]|nr:MAG: hypothetical protein A2Y25_01110 [Candidatus Melainabacteria bacterium GWF2_37_15]